MGKKQKLRKAAQMAANASAAAAKLQKEIELMGEMVAGKEKTQGGSGKDPAPCCSGHKGKPYSKDEVDPGYRNKIKKLMDLAQQLPSNVLTLQKSQEEKQQVTLEDSSGEGDSTDSEDEAPDLVDADPKIPKLGDLSSLGTLTLRSSDGPKHSRGEKKARRILMKLDLKPVEDVARVTMKKNKNVLLYIDKPDVFKVPHSETFICFGKVRVEDISSSAAASQAAAKAAERFRVPSPAGGEKDKKDGVAAGGESLADDDEDGEGLDEAAANLDEKDIELVEMQAVCSRKKAIRALLMNDNDVVNAIMALTVG
ncbi:nascent polypeptide-associated complex subunit alpha [Drosophila biarmipes]|uniref:nascent polypeptide-associated complex subunit alpha n=1 Tax=Drosophila biarmipes TaxID=125945 RepID=UPI0007E7B1AD|nr:nascent polypeptide-associated complex subunit alpha [Drosophila biarmipes]